MSWYDPPAECTGEDRKVMALLVASVTISLGLTASPRCPHVVTQPQMPLVRNRDTAMIVQEKTTYAVLAGSLGGIALGLVIPAIGAPAQLAE